MIVPTLMLMVLDAQLMLSQCDTAHPTHQALTNITMEQTAPLVTYTPTTSQTHISGLDMAQMYVPRFLCSHWRCLRV